MAFPDIRKFGPSVHGPCPYERQMGDQLAALLRVFDGLVPDAESHAHVSELATCPEYWSAGHAVFDEIRDRLLRSGTKTQLWQYSFEESCCKAIYNATYPDDGFDWCSPFFVVGQALQLALLLGIPLDRIAAVFREPDSANG
jgi:hypothetical protein